MSPLQCLLDESSDVRFEQLGIGTAIDHEECQHVVGVDDQEVAVLARLIDVDEPGAELTEHTVAVRGWRDDHRRLTDDEPFGKESRDSREQAILAAVELDGVILPAWRPCSHSLQG